MKTTEKTFDCIAFKRTAQMAIYEEIKSMSHDEELNYFRSHAEKGLLGEWWIRRASIGRETPCCAEKAIDYDAQDRAELKKQS